jgi:peptide/nickel transport system substrate-binding protein
MEDQSKVEQQKDLFRQASRLSRREVMRRGLALGLSMPIIGYLLAACGGDDDDDDTGDATSTTSTDGAGATSEPDEEGSPSTDAAEPTTGTTGDTAWYVDPHPGPPQPGGMLNYLLYEDPDTLNPLIGGTGLALQPIVSMLEPLAETLPDGSWTPILAAEIPTIEDGGVSEDLLTITWKLREGVLWHDGEPFTSDDVKFTWEAASSVDGGSIVSTEFERIVSVDTPDDLTAVVTYSEFNVGYIDQFPYIIPRHATGDVADMLNWDFNRAPVGTGPFAFEEWAAAERVTVVKNETYREEGKPYLDGINFLVIPSEESRAAQMLQGDAHIMLWPGQEADDDFEASDVAKVRLAPGIWTARLHFNLSEPFDDDPSASAPHPLFGDLAVRQAIGMAINRDRIVNEVVSDVVLCDSIFKVGWINVDAEPWEFDPEGAMALLEEAGWVEGDGGIREKDGVRAEFVCNGYTSFTPNELSQLAIQEDLKNIGIDMRIENQDFAVIFGTWEDGAPRKTGDYDALFYDGGFFIEPHDSIYLQYHPSQVPTEDNPGGQNYWRWVRDDVGEWIDAAGATPDQEERRANYQKVADAAREDVIMIPVFQFTEGSAYSTRLHGFTVSTWEYSTWDCENWWFEE